MADPEENKTTEDIETEPGVESEGLGFLPWILPIFKAADAAFFAESLGPVVKDVVIDWAGDQAADKVIEGAEKAIDYKPPDLPPASPPVDMGGPSMGAPYGPTDEPIQNAIAPWDPSGETTSPSGDAGAPADPMPVDSPPDDAGFEPVDMGTAAMGVPFEPAPEPHTVPSPSANPIEPPVNLGPTIDSPPWDPSSDASPFSDPTDMPPIPLAPNQE